MRTGFAVSVIGLTVLVAGAADEFPRAARDAGATATVKVSNPDDGQTGSGVVILRTKTQAFVLTVCHVVPKAKLVEVQVAGGGKARKAEVLARAAESDLAVLRMTADGAPAAVPLAPVRTAPKFAASVGWEKGEAPCALDETVKGKVNLKRPGELKSVLCWETVRKQAAGRSGGPLVDEAGRVIGVATGHDGETGYYVHADEVHKFLTANGLKWILEEDR